MRLSLVTLLAVIAAATVGATTAAADPITFTAQSGTLSASVTFEASGTNLIVTLSNLSQADVLIPTSVLTAVFFDSTQALTLTRVSAMLTPGSNVFDGVSNSGDVGGEWAYKASLSGAPSNAAYGISSSGLGLFGPGDRFPGPNLQGPTSPDGLQYGLTSIGDNPSTGNGDVLGNALIDNGVVFTLSGLPTSFDPSRQISNVSFLYGTALTDPTTTGNPPPAVPEPGSLVLLGSGLLGLAAYAYRRK